jgi:branched-chain amino acid transport system permease protein
MLGPMVQNLVSGVLVGGLYGLAAVGLSLVFGVTKFLNVSHGELLMLGGYASVLAFNSRFHVDPFLSLGSTIISLLLVGIILYQLLFARMVKLSEEAKVKNTMLVGFGLSIILQNMALSLWTANDQGITTSYSMRALTYLGVRFPIVRVASLAIALVSLLALHLFLRRTFIGKAIRATAENWEAAALMGIDIHRVYLVAFVLGAAQGAHRDGPRGAGEHSGHVCRWPCPGRYGISDLLLSRGDLPGDCWPPALPAGVGLTASGPIRCQRGVAQ